MKTVFIIAGIGLIAAVVVLSRPFIYERGDVTEQEALEKIKALPEVQVFISELEKAGKTASFRVENRGKTWSVQVYEIVSRGEESHTATFNWYHVDKTIGDISKEFE